MHIAAQFGYTDLITKFANANVNLQQISRKTGLSALHIASFYGEEGNLQTTTPQLYFSKLLILLYAYMCCLS